MHGLKDMKEIKDDTAVPNVVENDGLNFEELRGGARNLKSAPRSSTLGATQRRASRCVAHVFRSTPKQRAAWYAAGYERAYKDLEKVFEEAEEAVKKNFCARGAASSSRAPNRLQLGKAILNRMAGYNQDKMQVDRQVYVKVLEALKEKTLDVIKDFRPAEEATNQRASSVVAPARMRRLPQLCKLSG